jgi:hypothetical protein
MDNPFQRFNLLAKPNPNRTPCGGKTRQDILYRRMRGKVLKIIVWARQGKIKTVLGQGIGKPDLGASA